MRLEPAMWDALSNIARREGLSLHRLCSLVDTHRGRTSLTSAIRVFVLNYYRVLASSLEERRDVIATENGAAATVLHLALAVTEANRQAAAKQALAAGRRS